MYVTELAKTFPLDILNTNDIWRDSPFKDLKALNSGALGKQMEIMTAHILHQLGAATSPRKNTGHDLYVEGVPAEIKGSTCWQNTIDNFRWQQIRPSPHYEIIFFLGINPHNVQLFWATKEDLEQHVFNIDKPQHTDSNTYWVNGRKNWFRDPRELKKYATITTSANAT